MVPREGLENVDSLPGGGTRGAALAWSKRCYTHLAMYHLCPERGSALAISAARRAILVDAAVSSMKTKRSGSRSGYTSNQGHRKAATLPTPSADLPKSAHWISGRSNFQKSQKETPRLASFPRVARKISQHFQCYARPGLDLAEIEAMLKKWRIGRMRDCVSLP